MRTQRDRDEQTVVIATALGIFTLVMVAVGAAAWWLQSLTHALDGHEGTILWPAAVLAGAVACRHVTSSTRR